MRKQNQEYQISQRSADGRTTEELVQEVNQLIKTMSQLERESRLDVIAQEELRADLVRGGENPELKQSPTKQDDFAEVLGVLKQAGVLDNSDIGIKRVSTDGSTEELVVKTSKEVIVGAE